MRDFLWEAFDGNNSSHLVSWEVVSKLKVWDRAPICNTRKVQFFSWLLVWYRAPICDTLQKRFTNISLSPNWCSLCMADSETSNHIFSHCNFAFELWRLVLQELEKTWTVPFSISDCFLPSTGPRIGKKGKALLRMIVQAVCWVLWLERNRRIFENKKETVVEIWAKLKLMIA